MHRSFWTFVLLSLIASQVCQAADKDLAPVEDVKRVTCQDGWTEFNENCYYFTKSATTRDEGQKECKSKGYGMAVIQDKETNDFIAKMGRIRSGYLWLGLNDKVREGAFVWGDGQPITYSNWNPGEPNSAAEDCTMMYLLEPRAGKWNDALCSYTYRTVCQLYKNKLCAPGWTEFNGNCYYITKSSTTREEGKKECRSKGYGMAVINDKATNDFIANMGATTIHGSLWLWLGLNDKFREGAFFWGDGQPMTYSNWNTGEPNSDYEDCTVMYLQHPRAGKWNDIRCSSQFRTVCQLYINNKRCKPGWTEFNDNCYSITQSSTTRDEGQKECKSKGYGMAVINDKATNDFIAKMGATISGSLWLGLNDKVREAVFFWGDGQPMTYSNWNPGEPNSAYEDCTTMYLQHPRAGKWNDARCSLKYRTVCQLDTSGVGPCPIGWTIFRNSCYLVSSRQANWGSAGRECNAMGANLVNIPDKETNDFVLGLGLATQSYSFVWVGANDRQNENDFYWNGVGKVTYTNWNSGEPNNNWNEDCVTMVLDGSSKGKWNDDGCWRTARYICQKNPI